MGAGESAVPQRLNRTRHTTAAHTHTQTKCNQCPVNKAKAAVETSGLVSQFLGIAPFCLLKVSTMHHTARTGHGCGEQDSSGRSGLSNWTVWTGEGPD